ncbi:OmpA family protein [Mangrovibacter plantisponsor]|uniref:OmpA family protein n=2 Tax=Mangrovibacter plantisponsor TaxID=451513 RepID=A0A317Q7C0_9ENTR|nr:OmpA family protein [Mangrovibacter plantisponsor]
MRHAFAPLLLTAAVLLTACQTNTSTFTHQQVEAMQSYGFKPTDSGWSLGMSDKILFDTEQFRLKPASEQKIQGMAQHLAQVGITHVHFNGYTDNYGDRQYNLTLSLKRANAVADAWSEGTNIPRTNLTTEGLGDKYPVASNATREGRAENRHVAVVITAP